MLEIRKINLPDIQDYYYISNYGEVYTSSSGKLKPMTTIRRRYEEVGLSLKGGGRGNRKKFFVHRLVLITFCPIEGKVSYDEYSDFEVNHKKLGNNFDNRLENLEWVSRKENMKHAYDNKAIRKGSDVNFAILTEKQVIEIKHLLSSKTMTQKQIANIYGVSRVCISNINTGKNWSHVKI